MTLEEAYDSDELPLVKSELNTARNLIEHWLDGGDVDADMARYIGLSLLSLAGELSGPEELPEA